MTRFSLETGQTSFRIELSTALRHTPHRADEWGKLRISNDGDTIRASEVCKSPDDGRDASFIRVCILSLIHMKLAKTNISF